VEKDKVKRTKKDLRAKCLNADQFKEENTWVLEVPYDIRDEAMNDLLKAYSTNFAKNTGRPFKIKPRTKKDERESIVIHSKHYNKSRGVYHKIFHGIKSAEPLPAKLEYDSRLLRTRLGHYYLCIPKPLEITHESQVRQFTAEEEVQGAGVIALDPGIRTFQTCYDPSGVVVEFGKNDIGRIYRLCHVMDDLQSRWSQKDTRHRKRYRLKKAARRIRLKIRNLIDDLHKNLVKWLCVNYRVILLPEFETSQMLRRGQRRIGSKTARAMATWSHYRFKVRLLNKTREYPTCKVVLVNESYTSKTCGSCGHIHDTLGGSKIFKCPKCDFTIDRDVNGARNILLRFLSALESGSSFV
jgi:putative transposase